jgi:hypothetical protein
MEKVGAVLCVNETSSTLLECDGRTLLIEDYSDLFEKIGTRYGGDGEVDFKIPLIESGIDNLKFVILTQDEVGPVREPEEEVFEDPDSTAQISNIVNNARNFGTQLMNKFTLENITMGITQVGKTYALTMYCHKLVHFLSIGSLYAGLEEVNNLIADNSQTKTDLNPFITNDRLTVYKKHIETYLGI